MNKVNWEIYYSKLLTSHVRYYNFFLFQKVTTHKLCKNVNYENGDTTIQIGILHVLIKFCQYIYCLGYMTRLAISRCKKTSHSISRFEENLKKNAGGQLELLLE